MKNILIVYYAATYPLRSAVEDHLYSFERYSDCHCYYVNIAVRKLPGYLLRMAFDLIVFHTTFLIQRTDQNLFHHCLQRVTPLKSKNAVKIIMPQDEYVHSAALCDFIRDFDVKHVFTVAPHKEWKTIYNRVDFSRVNFHQILTGYLSDQTITRIHRLMETGGGKRTLDVGYRAWHSAPWLGRHGMLKQTIATLFKEKAPAKGLKVDISTDSDDTLLGDAWFEFLLRCRYTIGVEGGASIHDQDGKISQRTQQYIDECPNASFEEIEDNCFPGLDGTFDYMAISPRHLEACVTKTGQVLVEGEFNGVLIAGRHYIKLERDFSNIDEVLEMMKDESLRRKMVDCAYREIVVSGQCSYVSFVHFVLKCIEGDMEEQNISSSILSYYLSRATDAGYWMLIRLYTPLKSYLRKILISSHAGKELLQKIRQRRLG